jgi:hypothetical protein
MGQGEEARHVLACFAGPCAVNMAIAQGGATSIPDGRLNTQHQLTYRTYNNGLGGTSKVHARNAPESAGR